MKRLPLLALCALAAAGQDSDLLTRPWRARWISVPDSPANDYGVYHFRRTFDLPAKPSSFPMHVSADNRYVLFVNGERAGLGPARGDLYHWRYETYDIAPRLRAGKNVIAALVWNAGPDAPLAQITYQTGFLLAGDSAVDTGTDWKCIRDDAYRPEPVAGRVLGYYAAGPGDRVDGARYPWGWEQPDFDDSAWLAPVAGTQGGPRYMRDSHSRWMLVPRPIPMQELKIERLARVRRAQGAQVAPAFPAERGPVRIAANTEAELLLDQNYLTTAYPELEVRGGKGAVITIGYAEALYDATSGRKGNRDEIEGKRFVGYEDVFIAPGGDEPRTFRPLWWRTWRYLRIRVKTADEPLTIEDLRGEYTGYPFARQARFDAGSEELAKMLDVGWRTARLCAHETYMDCPYYEQLQYAGDTRIQALVSIYMSGDGRLVRNAIEQLDSSRTSEGATFSRAPSRLQQYIPPFSLWWIGMLHDYWMYVDDPQFVREMLPGVRSVLSFFAARQKPNHSLGRLPWWNFVDWSKEFRDGVPAAEPDGSSAPLDLQLLLAYQWAARMEAALGSKALAAEDRAEGDKLRAAIQTLYWDAGRRMYADTPRKASFSQHTQALAVLAGVIDGAAARDLITRAADDASLIQATIYFRYYLHAALAAAGAGDRYLDMLGPWRDQLTRGMTTWAEGPEPSRSDCHAWGASPNVELFRTVLGIDSAAPGFKRVLVKPALGKLERVSGAIPHPRGEIAVALERAGQKLSAKVTLPEGVEGDLVWQGKSVPLRPGPNNVTF